MTRILFLCDRLAVQETSANLKKRHPRVKDRGCLQGNQLVPSLLRPEPDYAQPGATPDWETCELDTVGLTGHLRN